MSMLLLAPFAMLYLFQNGLGRQDTDNECEGIDRASRVRGLYENKIRFFCGPEKIFEVFANSRSEEGNLVMCYHDFYKAVTPYLYAATQHENDYFKRFTPKTLNIIDADNSGQIEFTEFFFCILLLQVPLNTMRKQFLKLPDNLMDHDQFSQALHNLRTKTVTGRRQVQQVKIDARTISATEEEFAQTNKAMVDKIFAHKNKISYQDFLELRKEINEDLIHYQFFTLETDEADTISLEDFLKSTVICVNPTKHAKYLKRIQKVTRMFEEEGVNTRVNYEEYLSFILFLDDIEEIKRRVAQLKALDFDIFEQIFIDYMKFKNKPHPKTGQKPAFEFKISPVQIKALFVLLDTNENGDLEESEVMEVLQPKQTLGMDRDQKAKEDAKEFVQRAIKSAQKWFKELIY